MFLVIAGAAASGTDGGNADRHADSNGPVDASDGAGGHGPTRATAASHFFAPSADTGGDGLFSVQSATGEPCLPGDSNRGDAVFEGGIASVAGERGRGLSKSAGGDGCHYGYAACDLQLHSRLIEGDRWGYF